MLEHDCNWKIAGHRVATFNLDAADSIKISRPRTSELMLVDIADC